MLGNIGHDTIIVADRGYETYNNIAHLEARGIKYVIRIRSNHGIADKFNLTIDAETDFTTDILLTRSLTNAFKSNPEKYRLINSGSAFDFLPKGSKDAYPLRFRIIRIKISEGMYGTLVTNLSEKDFSADDQEDLQNALGYKNFLP